MKVGDTLWHEAVGNRVTPIEVVRVTKRYAHLKDGSIVLISTLKDKWGERYWLSEEAWKSECAIAQAWREFQRVVDNHYKVPSHLELADIYRLIKEVKERL